MYRLRRTCPLALLALSRTYGVRAAKLAAFLTTDTGPFGARSISRGLLATVEPPRRTMTSLSATVRPPSTPVCSITFEGDDGAALGPDFASVLVGKKSTLRSIVDADDVVSTVGSALGFEVDRSYLSAALDSISGKSGSTSLLVPSGGGDKPLRRLSLCALPDEVSRNNHPLSVHAMSDLISKACPGKGDVRVAIAGASGPGGSTPVGPLASAVARAFPLYSRKTADPPKEGKEGGEKTLNVRVAFLDEEGGAVEDDESVRAAAAAAESVRLAARLVDTPPAELTTEAFADECAKVAKELGDSVTITVIAGDDLRERGYGGLYGVGQAAVCPPRMVIMEYNPAGDEEVPETVALVGKGIVYDTGGLSLKGKTGMPGMKGDMGGAAGMLGGFVAAVKLGAKQKIYLILCLAENAIGPNAFRNDDILTMYSGKTVEVNNCDAEGRLVLGDGVAHATKHFEGLDLVVDMATLTGAQLVATGKKHAGALANTAELEARAVAAGLRSGNLCFPLLYAPELLMPEFKSEVADMKNSVKDRGNAQSSCAGHFIEAHLDGNYKGGWLHLDMAGPSEASQRGTGYGVGLVLSLLNVPGF
uniref:Cytosol aminopeptidase domain-containing protein n=1 Tax=Trieres chinensis TaxID=1514140 RepID=A0A7S1ZBT7_TRICV|mmetsp:Transcript_21742/g.44003  ORF Transcript_21742/g.44003 Transcript_21742/m.44003 type:complete len:590 (+) Transcript_21742:70-1839(+)